MRPEFASRRSGAGRARLMVIERQPSCSDATEPESLAVSEAHKRLLAALVPVTSTERVPLSAARGRRLEASDPGVIASLGIDAVEVCRAIRVAFFTTGDELRALEDHAGSTLPAGTLFDSNRQVLRSLLAVPGTEAIDLGIVGDSAYPRC